MGNDGGTIASRKDILSLHDHYKKPVESREQDDTNVVNYCKLTSLPLNKVKAVVGDYKGNLYIKEKMLEYLISRKRERNGESKGKERTDDYSHISSLRDLVDVKISWHEDMIQCPILKDNLSIFIYLRPCGCVISHKALFQIKKVLNLENGKANCPSCNTEFHFNYDVVVIHPTTETHVNFNNDNYKYLTETLKVAHNKKPLKKPSKVSSSSSAPLSKRQKTK